MSQGASLSRSHSVKREVTVCQYYRSCVFGGSTHKGTEDDSDQDDSGGDADLCAVGTNIDMAF
jgi:hypothetical protein